MPLRKSCDVVVTVSSNSSISCRAPSVLRKATINTRKACETANYSITRAILPDNRQNRRFLYKGIFQGNAEGESDHLLPWKQSPSCTACSSGLQDITNPPSHCRPYLSQPPLKRASCEKMIWKKGKSNKTIDMNIKIKHFSQ